VTQFIDADDAAAVKRKAARRVHDLAGAEIVKAAFDIAGQKDEAVARARLEAMVAVIVKGTHELQTRTLKDLDAPAMEVEAFGRS
jgi:hypothetical protein